MAVDYKRMQQRFGTYSEYQSNESGILPNEIISVLSGHPNTADGTALYFKVGTNNPKRLVFADEIEYIVEQETAEKITAYIRNSITGVNPDYVQQYITASIDSEMSTLYGEDPYYIIPNTTNFNPSKDGLLIWQNGRILIPPANYSFVQMTNGIKIAFHLGQNISFNIGDVIGFNIYKKPKTNIITHGITIAIANGTSDSIYGIAEEAEE